ncbi:exodeoxyribonuclease VII large subunit [Flavobacterium sp. HJJ]|uniref:exodeoxyribonuclease VII large subunit n=1 Tax=Flavobacterium sp. HJJ TaxID=2783792 RepID=UPI00188A80E7|nr:exodeoxyribonuclease VII large subunit [Flavobacterium sp. HJJ]MBF4473047.1 exodeoxyribonuclease VII large subunit [Flavobacterium sp. HJJ]
METANHIKLSELNGIILETIKNKFSTVKYWIVADVTNHSYKADKKYHNFDLVEKDNNSNNIIAKIAGKAWGNGSMRISDFEKNTGQKFTNNINVLVQVSVEYHPLYGLSVNVIDIDTSFTLGLLEQKRNQTLQRLVLENEFIKKTGEYYQTRNSQLKLKSVIQKIALLSSVNSASGEDFKHTLEVNNFGYKFFIDDYHTIVQGESNSKLFLDKLIEIYNSKIDYDAIVITRGGGAQTDFLIFDDYQIGRAVAKFPIPIITGIGHQKNITIVDLMAHTQTKTPTKAAEFIIAHNRNFEQNMLSFQKSILIKSQQIFLVNFQLLGWLNSSIVNNARNILAHKKDEIVSINQVAINNSKSILFNHRRNLVHTSSQILAKPKIILYNRINDIKNTISNLKTFSSQYQKSKRGDLGHYISMIKMMAPENILKKGYAIVKVNNKITSNPCDIKIGSDIDIMLSDTIIKTTVKQKTFYNGKDKTNL